jgi:predicted enzyme related to lactoylglutathione lyase
MTTDTSIVTGVDFVVVATQDFDAAVEFYGTVLGPDLLPGEFVPNRGPIALRVDDSAAARAELESRGVTFLADTLDSGVCHMDFFRDPDGNALMLHQRYAPRT